MILRQVTVRRSQSWPFIFARQVRSYSGDSCSHAAIQHKLEKPYCADHILSTVQELSPPLKDTPVLQELETRLGQVFFRSATSLPFHYAAGPRELLNPIAVCRPLCPGDYERLKQCHRDSFPIDYEDSFFEQAVSSRSNTTSWAAVQQ